MPIFTLAAYRQAINLVNPYAQLKMLSDRVRSEFRVWYRRAGWTAPLFEDPKLRPVDEDYVLDTRRLLFFIHNPLWTREGLRAMAQAVSIYRRFSQDLDYEVAVAALDCLIRINVLYIEAKGRTFRNNVPFVEDPSGSDGFITATLEHLRQEI